MIEELNKKLSEIDKQIEEMDKRLEEMDKECFKLPQFKTKEELRESFDSLYEEFELQERLDNDFVYLGGCYE